MYDIATQLVMKWARQGPNAPIMVTDDFTRLTLDTIALCAMGTRFNSFYHDEMHPFVEAMVGLLQGSGDRTRRPTLLNNLPTGENTKYWNDITFLRDLAQELVDARKKTPEDKKDLLNAMVLGRDPQTGRGLTDDTIVDNMITFLIAGMSPVKETTDWQVNNLCRARNHLRDAILSILLPTQKPCHLQKGTRRGRHGDRTTENHSRGLAEIGIYQCHHARNPSFTANGAFDRRSRPSN